MSRSTGSSRGHWSLALVLWSAVLGFMPHLPAQQLPLPPRPRNALEGAELAARLAGLELAAREAEVCRQVLAGNVPEFLRRLCPVSVTNAIGDRTNQATFFVTPDYLALGSDQDYLLMPLSPATAQKLADSLGCSLPTRKMVDAIYSVATVKLAPTPIPPSPAMTSMAVFSNHNALLREQRELCLAQHPLGALVAGHKKDVVLSPRLNAAPGKVAIYGWHQTNGLAIQPLYLGHSANWVDYSQCIRLVREEMAVNGQTRTVEQVLADPALCGLLSDEGMLLQARYGTNQSAKAGTQTNEVDTAPGALMSAPPGSDRRKSSLGLQFTNSPYFSERVATLNLEPDIQVELNTPTLEPRTQGKPVLLVFYALPNGNTTAQTIGHKLRPGDDWHFDIQHIGAQVRFVRQQLKDRVVVVAYLENSLKSWPAWRKKYGDARIPGLLEHVKQAFAGEELEVALSGHSGGGSLIFGYLNALERVPDDVVRIAFLDSNYAYDPSQGHAQKLATWLNAGQQRFLCVLAYNDAVALLNGKPFVSPAGGTWGKSHQMEAGLAEYFPFIASTNSDFERFTALKGRVQFLLRENPNREVLHTVQVERNGFIHALLCGTLLEKHGYTYFGARAYETLIQPAGP